MRMRWLLTLAGLFLAMAAACTSGEADTPVPITSEGVLEGSVVIGPLCRVEPCSQGIGDTYSSRELQLQSESASGILVPLQPDGTFRASVPAGEYAVTVSNCDFLGCSSSLPVTVVIRDGETSDLRIDIDTGIRSVARSETSYNRLIDDFKTAGADVEPAPDLSSTRFFGVPNRRLTVNGSKVFVFEFPNIDDALAGVDSIGPDGYSIGVSSPNGGSITITHVDWTTTPHFYAKESLIVLYVGDDNDLQFLLEKVMGGQFAGGHFAPRPEPEVKDEADSTARRELSGRLGVGPEDLRLIRSQKLEFNNGALGCPDADGFYSQAIVPGYVLLYELNELRYPFHVSSDGRIFTDCRRKINVAVPFSPVGSGYLVHENDAFRMAGETLTHLGEEVVLQTLADAEEYLSEAGDSVRISLDRINWDEEMLVGTVITGSGCSADVWVSMVVMSHLGKTVEVNVEAIQTGLCERVWAKPIWLKVLEVPKDYSASFTLSYRTE